MYPGKWAKIAPERPAIILTDTGEQLTYAELEDQSARFATWLHEQGLRRGDSVALLATNSVEHYVVYWAVMRSGLYLTAINFHLLPTEVAYSRDDCGAMVLVASADLAELAQTAL